MRIDVLEILPDGTQTVTQVEVPDPSEEPTGGAEQSGTDDARLTALESGKADRTELQAIWDALAEAYQEGVNQA